MNIIARLMTAVLLPALMTVPAAAVSNPNTGDNSIVPIVVGVMAGATVLLIVVLLFTRNKR